MKDGKKLFILLLIALIAVSINFIRKNYRNSLLKEYKAAKSNYEKMKENLEGEEKIEGARKEYINELYRLDFPTELSQENIISVLHECTGKNKIHISNIRFSEDSMDYIAETEDDNAGYSFTGVSVELKLEFRELTDFIDAIKNYGNNISVTNVKVITWDDDIKYSIVDLKFYAVN